MNSPLCYDVMDNQQNITNNKITFPVLPITTFYNYQYLNNLSVLLRSVSISNANFKCKMHTFGKGLM